MRRVMCRVRRWNADAQMWEFVEEYESMQPETPEETERMINITKITYGKDVWVKENGDWRKE